MAGHGGFGLGIESGVAGVLVNLMAVTTDGQISTSPDGATWTKSALNITRVDSPRLIWNPDTSCFMCVDTNAKVVRSISQDGTTQVSTLAFPSGFTAGPNVPIAYKSSNKTLMIGGVESGNTAVAISVNGAAFTTSNVGAASNRVYDLVYDKNADQWNAITAFSIMWYSTNDGSTWSNPTSYTASVGGQSFTVGPTSNHLILPDTALTVGRYQYTTDGLNWNLVTGLSFSQDAGFSCYEPTNAIYGIFTSPSASSVTNAFGSTANPFTASPSFTYLNGPDASLTVTSNCGYGGNFYVAGGNGTVPELYKINSSSFASAASVTTGFTGSVNIAAVGAAVY